MKRFTRRRLGVGLIFPLAAVLMAMAPAAFANTWYVATTGNDTSDCLSPATACATIPAPLAKPGFVPGDTVRVAVGTYTGTGNEVVDVETSVSLLGGWDSSFSSQSGVSTIDGGMTRRGVTVGFGGGLPLLDIQVLIDRFKIQNGFDRGGGGGGIRTTANLTLTNSVIAGNVSSYPDGSAVGGGILNCWNLTVSKSLITGNTGDFDGGGIYSCDGVATITDSTIDGNTVGKPGFSGGGGGGGIESRSTLIVRNSAITNNRILGFFEGSGVEFFGTATLTNTTVSGNTGPEAIFTFTGTGNFENATIAGNQGIGIHNLAGTFNLTNSLIANNAAQDCLLDTSYPQTSFASAGYNLVRNSGNCPLSPTDLTNIDPLLGPLQDNGGPTFTQALLAGSPAINAIPAGVNGCGSTLTSDQRGVSRPQGAGCDIGAFEASAPADTTPPVITVPADITTNATSPAGAVVSYTVGVTDDTDANPSLVCTPPSGGTFAIGNTTVNCTAKDASGNQSTASFLVHVKSALEQLQDLRHSVIGVGNGTSLLDKATLAYNNLQSGHIGAACTALDGFISQATSQSGKSITAEKAQALISDARRIKLVIGC
jgi:HYR domain-containing protein